MPTTPTSNVPKPLWTPLQLGTAAATIYTSPAGQKGTRITEILLVNTGSSSTTVTLWHVPKGGSRGNSNVLCLSITIPADGFPVILEFGGHVMGESDTIDAQAGAATQVTCHGSGIEMN